MERLEVLRRGVGRLAQHKDAGARVLEEWCDRIEAHVAVQRHARSTHVLG